ncbi:MAG: amino acid carrier protein, partial [Flavobacteriales bacterium]
MKYYILVFALCILSVVSKAQMQLSVTTQNPTQEIGDATCSIAIEGGVAPFQYQWSKKDIPLASSVCAGMQEGIPYTISVTDSLGNAATEVVVVDAVSVEEKLNKWFTPLVDALALVLLWDPFAACGIYDPVVYDSHGEAYLHPNGQPVTQDCWLVVVLLIG